MLTFSKNWTNAEDFPTYEASEEQVRADMQLLHNETRDYINANLVDPENFAVAAGATLTLLLPNSSMALFVANDGYVIDGGFMSGSSPDARVVGMTGLTVTRVVAVIIHPAPNPGTYYGISFQNTTDTAKTIKAIRLAGDPVSLWPF